MVYVKILYGAYEANGIIKHRKQRLRGLKEALNQLLYHVDVEPTSLLGRLVIVMLDVVIYRGDLKQLNFNCCPENDPKCLEIIEVIEEARIRLYHRQPVPPCRNQDDCQKKLQPSENVSNEKAQKFQMLSNLDKPDFKI